MARIDAILKLVKEQGASDLHVTTGAPPMVRIHGEITPIPYEELTPELCELLLFETAAVLMAMDRSPCLFVLGIFLDDQFGRLRRKSMIAALTSLGRSCWVQ